MRLLQHSERIGAREKSDLRQFWQTIISWHSDSGDGGYDWSQGIRAAVGISIPTSIGLITGHLSWGILTALATFWTLMCDMGGAYRQKALTICGSGFLILLAYIFGAWITQSVPAYILGVFQLGPGNDVAGSSRGTPAAQAGLVTTTIVVVAVVLTAPNEFGSAYFFAQSVCFGRQR